MPHIATGALPAPQPPGGDSASLVATDARDDAANGLGALLSCDVPDFPSVVAGYLTARELTALRRVSRGWRDAFPALAASLRRVTYGELAALAGAGVLPPPGALRRLEALDLRGYLPGVLRDDAGGGGGWLGGLLAAGGAHRLRALWVGSTLPPGALRALVAGCDRLHHLCLAGVPKADDALLDALGAGESLQQLDLRCVTRVSPGGLARLVRRCPRVQRALLGGCGRVDDACLAAVAAGWRRLRVLELSVTPGRVTPRGLADAVTACPSLRSLRLAGGVPFGADEWRALLAAVAAALLPAKESPPLSSPSPPPGGSPSPGADVGVPSALSHLHVDCADGLMDAVAADFLAALGWSVADGGGAVVAAPWARRFSLSLQRGVSTPAVETLLAAAAAAE
jgi:hypothetical protein